MKKAFIGYLAWVNRILILNALLVVALAGPSVAGKVTIENDNDDVPYYASERQDRDAMHQLELARLNPPGDLRRARAIVRVLREYDSGFILYGLRDPAWIEAVAILVKKLPPDSIELGEAYRDAAFQGNIPTKARLSLVEKSVACFERNPQRIIRDPKLIEDVWNLNAKLGRNERSADLLERRLVLLDRGTKKNANEIASLLSMIVDCNLRLRRYPRAESALKRTMSMFSSNGENSRNAAKLHLRLSGILCQELKFEEALVENDSACRIDKKLFGSKLMYDYVISGLGPTSPLAFDLVARAEIYEKKGDRKKAESIYREALSICKEHDPKGSHAPAFQYQYEQVMKKCGLLPEKAGNSPDK